MSASDSENPTLSPAMRRTFDERAAERATYLQREAPLWPAVFIVSGHMDRSFFPLEPGRVIQFIDEVRITTFSHP